MSDYGKTLFSNFSKTINPPKTTSGINVVNGFLSIKKFSSTDNTSPSAQIIDKAIFIDKNLVFSPDGSLYFVQIVNGKIAGEYDTMTFFNPLTSLLRQNDSYNYKKNFLNWLPIDYKKFSAFNNEYEYPQYFLSIPGNLGYGVTGSGFILYRDSPYNSGNSVFNYYLLINPFDRPQDTAGSILINERITNSGILNTYCDTVQYQDNMCYCSNDVGNNRCVYGYAESQTAGDALLSSEITSDPRNIIAINTIKTHCGCNNICKAYGSYNKLSNPPACAEVGQLTLCATGITTGKGGEINLPNLTINTNCGPIPPPPAETGGKKGNIALIIVGAIVLLVVLTIVAFFILKKK